MACDCSLQLWTHRPTDPGSSSIQRTLTLVNCFALLLSRLDPILEPSLLSHFRHTPGEEIKRWVFLSFDTFYFINFSSDRFRSPFDRLDSIHPPTHTWPWSNLICFSRRFTADQNVGGILGWIYKWHLIDRFSTFPNTYRSSFYECHSSKSMTVSTFLADLQCSGNILLSYGLGIFL